VKLSATVHEPNPLVGELQAELGKLQAQRAALLEQYSPESQKVRALEAQIGEIRAQLARALKTILASTTESSNPVQEALLEQAAKDQAEVAAVAQRRDALRAAVGRHEIQLGGLPEKEKTLVQLVRSQTVSDRVYTLLLEKYHEARVAEAMSLSTARLVEAASTPNSPVKPRRMLNISLACALGLLLGLLLAALADYLDDTIGDTEDMRRYLNLCVLGAVPRFKAPGLALIPDQGERSVAAEAYRMLRTNIAFASLDQPARTVLITAAGQLEGKTTTTANLGITMAQEGRKVLLLDTDLRRPALHRLFHLDNSRGLTSVLLGSSALSDVIQAIETENLWVLTSGPLPPNPAELLNSAKMRELLARLRDDWDIVLCDSPPIVMAADAPILASILDGVVLVIEQHKTSRYIIAEAVSILRSARARLLGVAMNKWRAERQGYYYYYYRTEEG
jgi:capsular exopolysaccharide synthesis family protein